MVRRKGLIFVFYLENRTIQTILSVLVIKDTIFGEVVFKINNCICLSSFQARIKKIMQTDEEIGKVAAAVPVIICILHFLHLSV